VPRLSRQLAPGQADFLDVEPRLDLAQDGAVNAALVAQPEHGCALVGDHNQAQGGVCWE
jgi:hypothetical protein